MALPTLFSPKFTLKLPSNDQQVSFRPFLVAEEKALLMAYESNDTDHMINAIKGAISACVEGVDVSKIPYFDVEFLFLNLRAKSVGEEIKFTYKHKDGVNRAGAKCDAKTEVLINIDDVKIQKAPDHVSRFMIDETYGVQMKYPTIDTIQEMTANANDEMRLVAACIDYVYDKEAIYPSDGIDDALKFISQMNSKRYEKLTHFFETMPKLSHEVQYTCGGCGQVDTVRFEGVRDFF